MQDTELALLIDRLMRRIHFGLQSKAQEFDEFQVGPGGGIVLLTLAEMEQPALSELTRRVARDKSQMTRTMRSLENKELVARKACPEDARVTRVLLTPKGERAVADLQNAVAETIAEILLPISKDGEETLKSLLRRVLS
ncbi:MAG: MarR family transcriptional regulator [Pseudomonadota bacterium]